ncbi:Enoyl-CoA delta isomerase 1, peroxisomal, partial [Geodia barretti]
MFRLSLRSRSSLLHRLGFCGLRRASENVPLRRCTVEKVDQCVVVRLVSENKENRVNPEFLDAFHKALDQVESYEDAVSMVTTSEGKHFSLGLELELLAGSSYSEFMKYMSDVQDLFRRLFTFPLVTVAAVNGHIYAAGALLGLCHDHIIMNNSKGFFCLPEVLYIIIVHTLCSYIQSFP